MKFRNIATTSALITALAGTPLISGCKNTETIEQRLSTPPYNASELSLEEFTRELQTTYPSTEYSEGSIQLLHMIYSNNYDSDDLQKEDLSDVEKKIFQERFPWLDFNKLNKKDEDMISIFKQALAVEYAPPFTF